MKIDPSGPTDRLLYATALLFTESAGAGSSSATGFYFALGSGADAETFLVTNRHVIDGADIVKIGGHLAARANGRPSDENLVIDHPGFRDLWVFHPEPDVDICAAPMDGVFARLAEQDQRVFHRACTAAMVPGQDRLEGLELVEDIMLVGYPHGLYDAEHFYPLVRRGITASHPAVDFDGRPRFVIDAPSFPGSSGSPVFLYERGGPEAREGELLLLGILTSGPSIMTGGTMMNPAGAGAQNRQAFVRTMANLCFIEKAAEILRFLETLGPGPARTGAGRPRHTGAT